jgi:hypothetical protein
LLKRSFEQEAVRALVADGKGYVWMPLTYNSVR